MTIRRVLVALVVGCGLLVAAPATAGDADYGAVWRGDGVLKQGCRSYAFRYRLRPGGSNWGAEFFLVGPGREGLGTVNRLAGNDPRRGRGRFEVCRSATRPGLFRIRGKLTVNRPATLIPPRPARREVHWVKPVRFRLARP